MEIDFIDDYDDAEGAGTSYDDNNNLPINSEPTIQSLPTSSTPTISQGDFVLVKFLVISTKKCATKKYYIGKVTTLKNTLTASFLREKPSSKSKDLVYVCLSLHRR